MGSLHPPDRPLNSPSHERPGELVQAYFDHRQDLRRFIAARYGDDQADDLMQDLYLKASGLRITGAIRNPAAYLYRLALNLTYDAHRQRSRASARDESWRVIHHTSVGADDISDVPAMEDVLASRRRLALLADGVNGLPPKTQRVFRMHKLDGLTQAQTAAALGMSQRMVEKRLRAALTALLAKVGTL